MKVASNVKTKKKTVTAGPGDDKKKKTPPPAEGATVNDGRTIESLDARARHHDKATTIKNAAAATKRKPSPTDFASNAAPRVGGAAQKSTTVYTGKGALPGAKKLKKAPTRSVVVRRKKI